jgi:para-nitrobenzyl esterase
VFTPRADDTRRPVFVWFHGGAWTHGSADMYHGVSFCRRGDIVVVAVNYRLGSFGFLPVDALDSDFKGAGNNGIRDQIESLRWVQNNIAAFGGDPERVTIAGESAGGGSVMAILAAPEADGLYHQAIAQSPAPGFGPPEYGEELCRALLDRLGRGGSLDALLDASAQDIISAQAQIPLIGDTAVNSLREGQLWGAGLGFHPSVDGVVLHDTVAGALAAKGDRNVPLIAGTNADEGTLFEMMLPAGVGDEEIEARLRPVLGEHADDVIDAHKRGLSVGRPLMVDLFGEGVFRYPMLRAVDAQLQSGGVPAWVYRFTWQTPLFDGRMGSTHALELPFVWHQAHMAGWSILLGDNPPLDLADAMHDSWIAFCRTGNPSHEGMPAWPRYDLERRPTMQFDTERKILADPAGDVRRAWYGEAEGSARV